MRQDMKVESQIFFYNLFLNSKFSFNKTSIITKCLQKDLETLPEGSVSQNFDLSSRYIFMLCRNFKKKKVLKR